jgi:hypothetical protein
VVEEKKMKHIEWQTRNARGKQFRCIAVLTEKELVQINNIRV